jgi:hypothetical protein
MPIHVECHAFLTMTFIIDYLVIKQTSRVGDKLLLTTMSATSDCTIRPHGKPNPLSFIILCVRAVFSNKVLLCGRWLPAEQLHVYMHMNIRRPKSLVSALFCRK